MVAFQLSTYLRLGDERHLIETGDAALNAVDQDQDHKRASIVYADAAQAQLQLGNIAEGVAYARRALEAAQSAESTWGLHHLARVEKTLAVRPDKAARDLLGDILTTRRRALGSSPA